VRLVPSQICDITTFTAVSANSRALCPSAYLIDELCSVLDTEKIANMKIVIIETIASTMTSAIARWRRRYFLSKRGSLGFMV
jgi:hypothetical protein